MKNRQEIKETAKAQLSAYRGPCIGVYLLTAVLSAVLGGITLGLGAVAVMPVVMVGTSGFYAAVYAGRFPTMGDWFASLFDNFLRKLGGYLWMGLWIFLWALLFYIPGFIKAFAYSMTPFILADCPQVNAKDALRLSMRMTYGYKMDIFVAQLSFLGWLLLSPFTFGILQILHVGPYMSITMGGIYQELKKNAVENGVILPEEFEGAPVAP